MRMCQKCCPHGPEEPCTCNGCWDCSGQVVGCTCDIAWDCEHDRGEQLRELLSYCYVEAGRTDGGAADVYTDIGMRLKEILDGEQ